MALNTGIAADMKGILLSKSIQKLCSLRCVNKTLQWERDMKLNQIKKLISEMPFQHPGSMKRELTGNSFISKNTLTRNYKFLGMIEADDMFVELHLLDDDLPHVIGTVQAVKPDGEQTNKNIFTLRFKQNLTIKNIPKELDVSKTVQVDNVSVWKTFEGYGIASYAYSRLAEIGFIILSDSTQFTDGRKLWEKMARKAHLNSYKIFLLDDEYGFVERDGEPISYSGTNINAEEIWSSGDDFSKYHTLLVMKT